MVDQTKIKEAVRLLLEGIGEDVTREGLRETPDRIARMYGEIFAGMDEVITFKHSAYSRAVFAKGAVEAAKFLAGREAGMYDMSDVIANK